MARDVIIFDTTLRDGEQAPGNSMTPEAKLRLAGQLDALGVDVIEAGFPSASQGDQQAVRAVAETVRRSAVAALARCHDRDIELAGEALRPAARSRVHVFIATSDLHLEHKLKISREDCVARAEAAIRRARRLFAVPQRGIEDDDVSRHSGRSVPFPDQRGDNKKPRACRGPRRWCCPALVA